MNYLGRKRRVLPAIYNSNLARYNWHAPEPPEQSCNAIVHVKLEHEINHLQTEIRRLQGQIGIHDLDPIILEDLQMEVMDDDDDDGSFLSQSQPSMRIQTDPDSDETYWSESSSNRNESNGQDNMPAENSDNINSNGNVMASTSDQMQSISQADEVNSLNDIVAGNINFTTDVSFDSFFHAY